MRTGIISCQADTSLRAIAELMASYHVHAVVVETAGVESGAASGQGWGIVSDVELARAAARGELAGDRWRARWLGCDVYRTG